MYADAIRRLDENYEFVDKGLSERVVRQVKEIYQGRV